MMQTRILRGKPSGIGLLELMLSLAIIAILLIMATRYYQSTSQSQKVNQAAGDIQAILAAAANYNAGNPGGVFTISKLISSGYLPSSMGSSAANANPWGGAYTAVNTAGNPTQVTITLTLIPTTACNALDSLMTSNYVAAKASCTSNTYSGLFGMKMT